MKIRRSLKQARGLVVSELWRFGPKPSSRDVKSRSPTLNNILGIFGQFFYVRL